MRAEPTPVLRALHRDRVSLLRVFRIDIRLVGLLTMLRTAATQLVVLHRNREAAAVPTTGRDEGDPRMADVHRQGRGIG